MARRAVLREHRNSAVIATVVFGVGILMSGSGPMNGDMAVYLHQVEWGAPFERWTHVGFILFFMMFEPFVSDLSLFADGLAALCLATGVYAFARALTPAGKSTTRAALLLGALVLPASGFGEVDSLWFALCGLGVWSRHAVPGAVLLGAAVCVSPTALAMVPFGIWHRPDARWSGAALAVLGLSFASMGAWWWGTRGVGLGWSPAPGRWLGWVVPVLLLCPPQRWPLVLLGLPALFAPGDLPGHWIVGLPLVHGVAHSEWKGLRRQVAPWILLALWGSAGGASMSQRERIRSENHRIRQLAAEIEPGEGLLGPWSWAMRVGLEVNSNVPKQNPSRCPSLSRVHTPSGEVTGSATASQSCDAIFWVHYSARTE